MADIECICDRSEDLVPVAGQCKMCDGTRWIPGDSGMDDGGPGECPDCCERYTPLIHDAVIDAADVPLIVPHGAAGGSPVLMKPSTARELAEILLNSLTAPINGKPTVTVHDTQIFMRMAEKMIAVVAEKSREIGPTPHGYEEPCP